MRYLVLLLLLAKMAVAQIPGLLPEMAVSSGSCLAPGIGIIFRAHAGPGETACFLRGGFQATDGAPGQLALAARGALLLPLASPASPAADFAVENVLRFGSPENQPMRGWPDANILDHAFGPTFDYAWMSSGYPAWYIDPGFSAPAFGARRKLLGGMKIGGACTWDRQLLFVKGATPAGPTYLVVRDAVTPDRSSNIPGLLPGWLFLNLRGGRDAITVDGERLGTAGLAVLFPGKRFLLPDFTEIATGERRTLVRLAGAGDDLWIAYPLIATAPLPEVKRLAPGVVRVETPAAMDYLFLAPAPFTYKGAGVTFSGTAGAVKVTKETVTLSLLSGGSVGYQRHELTGTQPCEKTYTLKDIRRKGVEVTPAAPQLPCAPTLRDHQFIAPGVAKAADGDTLEYLVNAATRVVVADQAIRLEAERAILRVSPRGVRCIVPTRAYARLTAGPVGVRGMGPFDLTFTPDGITGAVTGDARTLVTTWPGRLARPQGLLDGINHPLGIADASTIRFAPPTPLFALAFSVPAGTHAVVVREDLTP